MLGSVYSYDRTEAFRDVGYAYHGDVPYMSADGLERLRTSNARPYSLITNRQPVVGN